MADDGVLVIPVGHDLGVLHRDGRPRCQQVRVGLAVTELSDEEFTVWLLAHGIDDQDRPTSTSIVAAADRLGLEPPTVAATLERFLADGLLVAVDPDDDSAIAFAERHQLFPLLLGLGPDAEQPWLQTVGVLNQPVAQVSNAMYDVWSWAQLAPQLWTGCHDAAEVARRAGIEDPEELDPRRVLSGVLRQVHGLLCVRAAYFDQRRAG